MLIKPFFKIGLIVVFVLIYNSTILAQKVLDTVVVLPPQLSTVFFGSNQQDITDYEFVREGFLIASYSNISNSSFLFLLSKSGKILYNIEVPFFIKDLYCSCINRYYACSNSKVYEILFQNGIIYKEINTRYFYEAIQYYVGNKNQYFYITGFSLDKLMQGFFLENTELNLISKTPFTVIPRLKDIEKRLASDINNKKNYNKTWPALANLSKYNEIQNPDNYYLDNVQTFGESAYQLINFEAIRTPFFVMDSVLLLVNYFQNIIERYQFNGTYLY